LFAKGEKGKNMDIDFENIPKDFVVCFNEGCLLGKGCLRRIAILANIRERDLLLAVNASKFNENNCKYFLENKKARIAYGMKQAHENLKAKDLANIRNELIEYFGQNYYYKKRKGKMPITPKEQNHIASVFKQYGYEIKFDRVEVKTLWK
jgi:hypothetical protein